MVDHFAEVAAPRDAPGLEDRLGHVAELAEGQLADGFAKLLAGNVIFDRAFLSGGRLLGFAGGLRSTWPGGGSWPRWLRHAAVAQFLLGKLQRVKDEQV